MKSKVWLVLWGRSVSGRCPAKVIRDIGGTNLFEIMLMRHLQYFQPDRVVASVPEGPQDDLLARWVEQILNIEVFRNGDNGPLHINADLVEHFGLDDDDIQVNASPDIPFTYIEDIQHRINALADSDMDFTESLSEGFPCRDWEWACAYKRVWRGATSRMVAATGIDAFGSQARPGDARLFWAMLIESGLLRPLIIEKPEPAKEPWPHQPLWVDEPEHFEQARVIVEVLGADGLRDRAIRELLADRPEIVEMTANAPRSTVKIFQEYRRGVEALMRVADEDGFVPQWTESR